MFGPDATLRMQLSPHARNLVGLAGIVGTTILVGIGVGLLLANGLSIVPFVWIVAGLLVATLTPMSRARLGHRSTRRCARVPEAVQRALHLEEPDEAAEDRDEHPEAGLARHGLLLALGRVEVPDF